jgi:hypothetical protein
VVRLNRAQLDGLLVAASMAADQAARRLAGASDPASRDHGRVDAARYRHLARMLKGAVAAEVTVWVAEE